MKRIIALIKIDLTNAIRDSLVIYILVAPLLLAGGLRMFLPSVEGSTVTFAVEVPGDAEAPAVNPSAEHLAALLERYGRVEQYDSAGKVRNRVLRTDNAGGFVWDGETGRWLAVLEGNEGRDSAALVKSVFAAVTGNLAGEYTVSRTGERSPFREYASVGLVMLATLIGGLAVSFAMIEEKENDVTRAFTVTPLGTAGYFTARGILAGSIGIVVATIGHTILVGTSVPFSRFLIAVAASLPLPLLVAILIGGIAKNQIQAVALLKIVMMVYLTIPFASIAVPRAWHWLFYIFPNYWMFRLFENLYVVGARTGDFPLAAGVTGALGIASLIGLGTVLGKQLKPR